MNPCAYSVAGRGCECAPEGGPLPVRRWGLCAVHSLRVHRTGELGQPGHRKRARKRRQGIRQDDRAESFLELPARATWGALLVLRPGLCAVQWPDGTRQRIPWPRIQAWTRRGWVEVQPRGPESKVQQLDIVPGARAAARRVIETTARNRAKFGVRSLRAVGSDEA